MAPYYACTTSTGDAIGALTPLRADSSLGVGAVLGMRWSLPTEVNFTGI